MVVFWLARGEVHLPLGRSWLSDAEAERAAAMSFTKRRSEFLIARWAAKQALSHVLSLPATSATLRRLEVRHAVSGAPVACLDGRQVAVHISLTDRADWAVCLVGAEATRIGCDLELVEMRSAAFVRDYFTDAEQRYVDAAGDHEARELAANLVWSATESGLKVLTTGLRRDTRSVEVTIDPPGDAWGQLTVRTAEGQVFPGWWRRFGRFVLTVAAEKELPPPTSLDDPPLLDGAEPTHSWLRQPVTAQPAAAIPRSNASMT